MRTLLITVVLCIFSISIAIAEEKPLPENPGYFKSPGFIAIGGTQVYHGSNTKNDKDIRPFILGMLNLYQSEYGNIGLSLGSLFTKPRKYNELGGKRYKTNTDIFTAELGINYYTGSDLFNLWVGGGYNFSFVNGKTRPTDRSSGSKSVSDTVGGWHYYVGAQMFLKPEKNWGLFFLFRGQESKSAKFSNPNGTYRMNLNNKTYILGLSYHF